MNTFKAILVTAMVALTWHATASAGPIVAVWGAQDLKLADVQAKVMATGMFDAVDAVNVYAQGVPTLEQAQAYDSILIFGSSNPWGSARARVLGDVLADYADAGGGVVTATFVIGSNLSSWILGGRFNSDRYHVMKPMGSQTDGQQYLGTVYLPSHPLMEGVDSLDGGSSSYRVPLTQLTPDSTRVADWTNGTPLVAFKELPDMGRRVDLNFYPPSSDVRSDFWNVATDGDLLLANALNWSAVPEPATLALLAAGAGGAVLWIRRRARRKLDPISA